MNRIDQTASTLRSLLTHNPQYRQLWQQHVVRARSEGLSHAGVAKVLALYLWDSGERSETDVDLARQLRDRVRRALTGQQLSGETLTWFIRAFNMVESDERQLWSQYSGSVAVPDGGISFTLRTRRPLLRPQRHRTLALFERYFVSSKRRVIRRHTLHVIEALQDGVDAYFFNHEPGSIRVEVMAGGRLGRQYDYGEGLRGHDIELDRPLRTHFTAAMEYQTYFDPSAPVITEVRRPVHGRAQNVDIAVQYETPWLPFEVHFAAWDDHLLGQPVMTQQAAVDDAGLTHRFLPYAESAVIGFEWTWLDESRDVST